jgi:hypothetical protein
MSYHLFLNDSHQPEDIKWIELPQVEWVIVRTYEEFVETIEKRGMPCIISFDHDIYPEHYAEYTAAHDERSLSKGIIRYPIFKEKTGYDAALWLANYCVDREMPIPLYYIHTLNPIGRMNIFSILESARQAMSKE